MNDKITSERRSVNLPPICSIFSSREDGLLLTPLSHGTDGFYIHVLRRTEE
ncbi:MAG: hypothetical protein SH859_08930 [Hyphomicrobium aestuarii]|nr:hypothetical protein [Hyphomicrobium aestuarii]